MNKFCPKCGKRLPENALFCDGCGTRMPDMEPAPAAEPVSVNPGEHPYAAFQTCTEAAEWAIRVNTHGEWSHWDIPDLFSYNPKKILKFAKQEDERLQGDPGCPTYVISKSGALGQILPEYEGEEAFFEWCFYTPEEGPNDLPQSLQEIKTYL